MDEESATGHMGVEMYGEVMGVAKSLKYIWI